MLMKPRSKQTVLSFAVSAALGVAGSNGWAQELDEETVDTAVEKEIETVVVTGSRIKRDGYSSASPMDVISAESAVIEGIGDVGSLLQTTTIASGSAQVTSATSSAFVQEGGIGTSTISLRGLGAARTLVLLNGRRMGPSGVRGQVSSPDLNVLPIVAVDRIEVLKDGASTVYGSDAVAGVVNIITRRDDGLNFDIYTAQPSKKVGLRTASVFAGAILSTKGTLVSSVITARKKSSRRDIAATLIVASSMCLIRILEIELISSILEPALRIAMTSAGATFGFTITATCPVGRKRSMTTTAIWVTTFRVFRTRFRAQWWRLMAGIPLTTVTQRRQ